MEEVARTGRKKGKLESVEKWGEGGLVRNLRGEIGGKREKCGKSHGEVGKVEKSVKSGQNR